MSGSIHFTDLDNRWRCFNRDRAELKLPPTTLHPEALYRLKGPRSAPLWVKGSLGENGNLTYIEISEHRAARAFVERGLEAPEDLAYHLVLDESPIPWRAPGAKAWIGIEEASIGEILRQTSDFRFVIEYRNRRSPDKRFEAITPTIALNWLDYNGYGPESDAVLEEVRSRKIKPTNEPTRSPLPVAVSAQVGPPVVEPTADLTQADPRLRIATPDEPGLVGESISSISSRPMTLPKIGPCHKKALLSYKWASTCIERAEVTDMEAYNYLRDHECPDYANESNLPKYENWARYLLLL